MPTAAWPPGPKGTLILGHLKPFRRDIVAFLQDCARTYGDFVPFRLLTKRCVLLSRPDLIEQVLVTQSRNFIKHFGLRMNRRAGGDGLLTSEGDFWRRQRRLSAPAFQPARLSGYGDIMVGCADRLSADFAPGQVRDLHEDMMRLTLDVASKTLFGTGMEDEAAAVGKAVTDLIEGVSGRFKATVPWPLWVPTAANRRVNRARRVMDAVILGIIARRRADGTDRGDLLSMLLKATDDEGGGGMSEQQLLAEAGTLLVAGHETTAVALAWTWHLLGRHPEVEAKLEAELREVLGGRAPSAGDLPRLVYAERVITESMRLYPPAYVIGREAVADCTIGGYAVPAGTTVYMSQWVMHRDARLFPDPERFDPDRWADGLADRLPRGAYFPFGGGPRVCIGNAFAMMEAVLLLAAVARRFRFRPVEGHPVVPRPAVTLRPQHGLKMTVAAR